VAPRRIDEIAWSSWEARDTATLVFVVEDDRVLLIRKKRGLGAGKINGPGGRLEPGETLLQCAVREIREELCITPQKLELRGELRFQFLDGYSIHVHVFHAEGYQGRPTETEEAVPLWFRRPEIPYDQMWEDDVLWVPHLLDGGRFEGCFLFEGDRMLDHRLDLEPAR